MVIKYDRVKITEPLIKYRYETLWSSVIENKEIRKIEAMLAPGSTFYIIGFTIYMYGICFGNTSFADTSPMYVWGGGGGEYGINSALNYTW